MSRFSTLVRTALVLVVGFSATAARAEDVRKSVEAGNAALRIWNSEK